MTPADRTDPDEEYTLRQLARSMTELYAIVDVLRQNNTILQARVTYLEKQNAKHKKLLQQ